MLLKLNITMPNPPPFKEARWHKALYALVLVITTSSTLWVMRSGALALWDRYSPESTTGPIVPWVLAIPLALLGGIASTFLVMAQLELSYDRWRERRDK